jgi:nicotinamidase-related amidase
MKTLKISGLLLAFFAMFSVNAQEVTDYDLQNFAHSYIEMMKLNKAAQNDMAKEIEKSGLELEVYHAINDTKDSEFIPELEEEEFEKFDKVQPKILKIQSKLEAEVEKVYAKNDLTKKKYTAIAERVKQDYILQAKLEKILERRR